MSQFESTQELWPSPERMDVRRQKYLRRASAARKLQAMYRRHKGRANQDQRDLSRVIRRYRRANLYQIQPSAGRSVTFWRKTELSYQLNQSTGFQGAGNNVNFGFSLGRLIGFTSGVFQISQAMPNSAEFQALFDYYKIDAVKMQVFFTKTNNDQSSGNTLGMPMLLICNDFDDIAESMTRESMMERVGCRHVQFDATNANGINHYIRPKPGTVIVQTDVATGAQSTASAGIAFGSQWIDTATSNIVHNGIKVFYSSQGLTSATVLGNITFVFDVCYVFKGYR